MLNKAVSKLIIKFDFGAVLFVIEDYLREKSIIVNKYEKKWKQNFDRKEERQWE